MVKGDVKGLNWNGIINPLPGIIATQGIVAWYYDRVPKRTIVVRTGDKPCFENRCVLAHRAMQRTYRVWGGVVSGRRLTGESIE